MTRGRIFSPYATSILILAALICFIPSFPKTSFGIHRLTTRMSQRNVDFGRFAASAALIILSALSSATSSYSPFIYFQF